MSDDARPSEAQELERHPEGHFVAVADPTDADSLC
jgi:hypothetical protein